MTKLTSEQRVLVRKAFLLIGSRADNGAAMTSYGDSAEVLTGQAKDLEEAAKVIRESLESMIGASVILDKTGE